MRAGLTDPNVGMADLFTGSVPGPIVVRITCPNGPTADVTVMVQATATPTPTASVPISTATPTNDRAATPRPPSTGFGSTGAIHRGPSEMALLAVVTLGVLGISLVAVGARLLTRKNQP